MNPIACVWMDPHPSLSAPPLSLDQIEEEVVLLGDRPRRSAASSACGPAAWRAVCACLRAGGGRASAGAEDPPHVRKASASRSYHQQQPEQSLSAEFGEGGREKKRRQRNGGAKGIKRAESESARTCARSETRVGGANLAEYGGKLLACLRYSARFA